MRIGPRTPPPRHLAGRRHLGDPVADRPADFDVEAALTDPDFDFEALFVEDDELDEPAPRARVGRHRVAFAVSVTLAALPLLVVDNLPATAGTDRHAIETEHTEPVADHFDTAEAIAEELKGTIEPEAVHTPATVAPAAVFIQEPPTTTEAPATAVEETTTTRAPTTTAAPAPTTTAAPAPTTTAPPATTPPTTAAAATAVTSPDPSDPATWDRLAKCESGGNWAANTGNGYYGGLQFSLTSWQWVGGTGYPHEHPKATQIEMGKRLHAKAGWSAWPGCARKLGWS